MSVSTVMDARQTVLVPALRRGPQDPLQHGSTWSVLSFQNLAQDWARSALWWEEGRKEEDNAAGTRYFPIHPTFHISTYPPTHSDPHSSSHHPSYATKHQRPALSGVLKAWQ